MNKDISALTGLRGIAALWVLACHTIVFLWHCPSDLIMIPLKVIGRHGYLGVDIFFALSGFVLAYTYATSMPSYGTFLKKRIARIYPVHLFMLAFVAVSFAVLTAFGVSVNDKYLSLDGFIRSVLLVQAWDVPIKQIWNPTAWSLSAEWLAYLCFPSLLALASRIKTRRNLLLLIVLFNLAAFVALLFLPARESWEYGLLRICVAFPSGILLWRLWNMRKSDSENAGSIAILALVSMAAAPVLIDHLGEMIAPVLAYPIVYFVASAKGRVEGFLSCGVMQRLGRISFALYLVHFPVFMTIDDIIQHFGLYGSVYATAAILAAIPLNVILADFLYHRIEEPARIRILSKRMPIKASALV